MENNITSFLNNMSLQGKLLATQESIKKLPNHLESRWEYFYILCLLGLWEKAVKQLDALASMTTISEVTNIQLHELLNAEIKRKLFFNGVVDKGFKIISKQTDVVQLLVDAVVKDANMEAESAMKLREKAFESLITQSGILNQHHHFEYFIDSDSRFGGSFELLNHGDYQWICPSKIKSLQLTRPKNILNLIWIPVVIMHQDGHQLRAYTPSRYPIEGNAPEDVYLAKITEWQDVNEFLIKGVGQKTYSTASEEYGILEIAELEWQ